MMCDTTALPQTGTGTDTRTDTRTDTGSAADERRGRKRKISLSSCGVCGHEEARYRCPSCLKCSCSVACVKQHKLGSGCSGVRDPTTFIPLAHYSDLHLLNDYRFLEETGRIADKPNRDTLLHTRTRHSYCAALLLKNAKAAKVNLKILPKSFSRRRENTSIYNKTERKIYWHLKLVFPQSAAEYTERVPEDRLLEKILSDYVHPTESDPVKRQNLKTYVLAPPPPPSVFMKSEQRLPNSPKYHELDVKKSLRENLMLKTVVEFPELHVVLEGHREEYLARVPDGRIVSSRPSKVEKEPTTKSETEEGEVHSEDEEE